MATIAYSKVVQAVQQLAVEAAFKLPGDVRRAIEEAIERESVPLSPGQEGIFDRKQPRYRSGGFCFGCLWAFQPAR